MALETRTRQAARLVYKALHTTLAPANDSEYRELLAMYRADPAFAELVQEITIGMELSVLDVSERGLVVVPAYQESKFSTRITDIRTTLTSEQKAALVLVHIGIAAVFYPTTDGLDNDNYVPPPASIAQFRDTIHGLARRLKESEPGLQDVPLEIAPGWELISSLPLAVPSIPSVPRAGLNTIVGLIKLALSHMTQGGLTHLDRDTDDDALTTYTATHRLRIQLRELTLRRLFELAQHQVTTPVSEM